MMEAAWLPASLAWDRQRPGRVGVVPLLGWWDGRFHFGVRWEQDGPLLGAENISAFVRANPRAAGFAITLDNSAWGGPRFGCVDDDAGKHDPGELPRPAPLGGYRESTRSGGFHDVFVYRTSLPPGTPSRVTHLGGFVDVLAGGLMVTAPTVIPGQGAYRALVGLDVPIPEFPSVGLALAAAAPWLRDAWRAAVRGAPPSVGAASVRADPRPVPADVAEVLARMKQSGRAGELAAWIAEHTDGDHRDFSLCFAIATHAAAVGSTSAQIRDVVSCPHSEWTAGEALERKIAQMRTRPPAGVAALLRYAEGQAAARELPTPTWRPVAPARMIPDPVLVARYSRKRPRRAFRAIPDPRLVDRYTRVGGVEQ